MAAKLTAVDVRYTRTLSRKGVSVQRLAWMNDVAPSTIYQALRGDTWSHIRRPAPVRLQRAAPRWNQRTMPLDKDGRYVGDSTGRPRKRR